MSQSSYFKSRPDLVTLGGVWGDLKSWKTLRLEGLGETWREKISTSPRYMIDNQNGFALFGVDWGVDFEKLEKMRHF